MLWRVSAADIVGKSDGDGLNAVVWEDTSGNNRDWTFEDCLYQTNEVNGHPAVQFRGQSNNDRVVGPNLSGLGLTEIDVYLVVQAFADPATGGATYGLWQFNNADYATAHSQYPDTGGTIRMTAFLPSTETRMSVDPTPSLTAWRLLRVTAKTGSNNYTMDLDGANLGTETKTSLVFPATTYLGEGSTNGGTARFKGMVTEFFAFSTKCGSTQLGTIHSYLNTEYGFSLP